MTKDEAKDQYREMLLAGKKCLIENGNDIIDLIYNDFKSRNCKNCFYYDTEDMNSCLRLVSEEAEGNFVDKDFGCNKWEQK